MRVRPVWCASCRSLLPWLQGSYGQGIGEELVVWVSSWVALRQHTRMPSLHGAPALS